MPFIPAAAAKPADEENQSLETPAEIKAMSPRKATVLEHHACYSMFRAADGKIFGIGSPAAGSQVVGFLYTLKAGTIVDLPRAFVEFEKASPAFDTAEKIKAMPPCKVLARLGNDVITGLPFTSQVERSLRSGAQCDPCPHGAVNHQQGVTICDAEWAG